MPFSVAAFFVVFGAYNAAIWPLQIVAYLAGPSPWRWCLVPLQRPIDLGTGFGSAWLRLVSFAGPMVVGFTMAHFGIGTVFAVFAAVPVLAAIVTGLCAIETKGAGE